MDDGALDNKIQNCKSVSILLFVRIAQVLAPPFLGLTGDIEVLLLAAF